MRRCVTFAAKKHGPTEVVFGPDVPLPKQEAWRRMLKKNLDYNGRYSDFDYLEVWDSDGNIWRYQLPRRQKAEPQEPPSPKRKLASSK